MTFPTTSIIDNFNRANEGPPPSASWAAFHSSWAANGLKVKNNHLTVQTTGNNAAYWIAPFITGFTEVYATVFQSYQYNSWSFQLILEAVGVTGTLGSGGSSYRLKVTIFGATGTYNIIRDYHGDGAIITSGSFTFAAGNSFGLSQESSGSAQTLRAYRQPSGSAWTELASVVDNSGLANTTGVVGLLVTAPIVEDETNELLFDDFGGGLYAGAVLTPIETKTDNGVSILLTNANSAGNQFDNDGRSIALLHNPTGDSHVVTFATTAAGLVDRIVTVGAGQYVYTQVFPIPIFGAVVHLTCDAPLVRMAVLKI